MELLGLAIFGGIAVVAILISSWIAKRRREAMRALPARYGWRWIDNDPRLPQMSTSRPFGVGFGRRAHNVLSGQYGGRAIAAFDYVYKTRQGSGKNRRTQTHRFTVWFVFLPAVLPWIEVGPEGPFGGRVAKAFGFGDLQVEHEEFNKRFKIDADDHRYAMAVIHPAMMELLLATGVWGWRLEGNLMVSVESGRIAPEVVAPRLDAMLAVLDRVPGFVWNDYGHQVRSTAG